MLLCPRSSECLKIPGDTPLTGFLLAYRWRPCVPGQLCALGCLQWLSLVFSFKASLLSLFFPPCTMKTSRTAVAPEIVLILSSITSPKHYKQLRQWPSNFWGCLQVSCGWYLKGWFTRPLISNPADSLHFVCLEFGSICKLNKNSSWYYGNVSSFTCHELPST